MRIVTKICYLKRAYNSFKDAERYNRMKNDTLRHKKHFKLMI